MSALPRSPGAGLWSTQPGPLPVFHVPGQLALPTAAEASVALAQMGRAAKADASRRNAAVARAARWPDGPGPIAHGSTSHMAKRCRAENRGTACPKCRAAQAARLAAWRAAQKEKP